MLNSLLTEGFNERLAVPQPCIEYFEYSNMWPMGEAQKCRRTAPGLIGGVGRGNPGACAVGRVLGTA